MISKLGTRRAKIRQTVNGLEREIETIMNDKSKLRSDREDLAQYKRESLGSKLNDELKEMSKEALEITQKAKSNYESARKQDRYDLQVRAAVLGSAIAHASNDDLMALFKNRASNRVDREIIGEQIKVRIDTTGDPELSQKYKQLEDETKDQLPENELRALKELEQAEALQGYMNNAITESMLLEVKAKTGKLESYESVKLKNAQYVLDQMEMGNTVNPDTMSIKK